MLSRMRPNVQPIKKFVKRVLVGHVVVRLNHGTDQRLPKARWPVEGNVRTVDKTVREPDKLGNVTVVVAPCTPCAEVTDVVRKARGPPLPWFRRLAAQRTHRPAQRERRALSQRKAGTGPPQMTRPRGSP
ncbi:hypothetical protein I4F81_007596 [Pyropia yezoensis]|uniref:Uncharacterized protein n=1 Tax=Pyropia yezoensis TaxID=2788 RepID=A0ACC3C517_PYRYE|nr:hypothetical protein I4F81_007596 [Neopyropia yezoensis]